METKKRIKILVINGPNLNMLGRREPEIYGSETLDEINSGLSHTAESLNADISFFQSNHEGDIVDRIQEDFGIADGIIINPAAYTHTSVAIRDALLVLDVPVVEIHLSNIYKRENFRHKSYISDIAEGQIAGFGSRGYDMALRAIAEIIEKRQASV